MISWLFRIQKRRLKSWKRNYQNFTPSTISAPSNVSSDSTSIGLPPPDPFFSLNRRTLAKSSTDSACKTATQRKLPLRTPPNYTKDATTKNQQTRNFTAKWSAPSVISRTLDRISPLLSPNYLNTSRIPPLSTWQKQNTSSATSKVLSTSANIILHHLTTRNLSPFVSLTPLPRPTPTTENHTLDTSL